MMTTRWTLNIVVFTFPLGCTTIIHSGKLADVSYPPTTAPGDVALHITANKDRTEDITEKSVKIFKESGLFRDVSLAEPNSSEKPSTLKRTRIDIEFEERGFTHLYCIITLLIIPCTPPLKWTIRANVLSADGSKSTTYLVEEDAKEFIWLFGFLIPGTRPRGQAETEVLRGMYNHLFLQMTKDNYL